MYFARGRSRKACALFQNVCDPAGRSTDDPERRRRAVWQRERSRQRDERDRDASMHTELFLDLREKCERRCRCWCALPESVYLFEDEIRARVAVWIKRVIETEQTRPILAHKSQPC